jgi:hypothetical protein
MRLNVAHRALLATSLGLALAAPAQATWYTVNATVAKVYSVDRTSYGAGDHFTLNGFASAGSCQTNDGLVAVYLADDEGGKRQLAVVLMARAMGWTLHVRVDDGVQKANGGCKLQILEIERS